MMNSDMGRRKRQVHGSGRGDEVARDEEAVQNWSNVVALQNQDETEGPGVGRCPKRQEMEVVVGRPVDESYATQGGQQHAAEPDLQGCRNCGAMKSASYAAGSFSARWTDAALFSSASAVGATDNLAVSGSRMTEGMHQDEYCSPECFWSAELADSGNAQGSHPSSRSPNSSMTLGVNPYAESRARDDIKHTSWKPSEGVANRSLDRESVQIADNAMFMFHGGLSSTFRSDRTLKAL